MTTTELLHDATVALVRSVDGLDGSALRAPSGLPGWSRAHVVAHLALNAEGLARSLEAHCRGRAEPQYDSLEARDADIEELAEAPAAELRARFLASTTRFDEAIGALHGDHRQGRLSHRPGGPTFPVALVPLKRLVEVAVHHADLALEEGREQWSTEVATTLVDALAVELRRAPPAGLRALDVDRSWPGSEGQPLVAGTAADLAWWLSGRGHGEGLTCEPGPLPELPAW